MARSGLSHWVPLLARYTTGQAGILVLNLVTGFLILRYLGVNEYAVYILASLLQIVGSLGSDLGASQGVVSIGASIRDNRAAFGALVRGAMRLRRRLFAAAVPVVLVIAYLLLHANESRLEVVIAVTVLSLAIAWVQQSSTIATAILNAQQDSSALVRSGLASAACRLALVVVFCGVAPYAVSALTVNLIGSAVHAALLWSRCRGYVGERRHGVPDSYAELAGFMKPLFPGIVYYMVQGHISTFLLGLSGAVVAVAEVGALGRLGQIIGVLMLLNGFFVQPYFARLGERRLFALRALQMLLILAVGFSAITLSSVAIPGLWLVILGPNYERLGSELVIALAGAQLSVAGAILYTMVIATRRTRGQWLQIPLGLGAQMAYLSFVQITATREALILNALPAATYLALQCGLLAYVLMTWKHHATTG